MGCSATPSAWRRSEQSRAENILIFAACSLSSLANSRLLAQQRGSSLPRNCCTCEPVTGAVTGVLVQDFSKHLAAGQLQFSSIGCEPMVSALSYFLHFFILHLQMGMRTPRAKKKKKKKKE